MTADEMVEQALTRLGEFTNVYPSSRGVLYRRIGYRQRQLFARAGKINPERYGTCAVSDLQTVSGQRVIDLNDITGTNAPVPETVQAVWIEDKGTSTFADGDDVHIVSLDDMNAELPPRALLRDGILIGVGADLALVTSLKISYPRLPALLGLGDKDVALELVAPWDTLLELDCAQYLVKKATSIAAEVRALALASFAEEEKELLAGYDEHVAEYGPIVSRFRQPRTYPKG